MTNKLRQGRKENVEEYKTCYLAKCDCPELQASLVLCQRNFSKNIEIFGANIEGYECHSLRDYGDKYQNILEGVKVMTNLHENFYLFHDDFFIISPTKNFPHYRYRLPIPNTDYETKLSQVAEFLGINWCGELHRPFLVQANNFKQIYTLHFRDPHFACCFMTYYAYHFFPNSPFINDAKIRDSKTHDFSLMDVISTNEESFNMGKVGEFIRSKINN